MEAVNERGNLESLLAPISYGDESPLPPNIPGKPVLFTGSIRFRGQIAESCDWGWAYNQSVFRCYSIPVSDSESRKAPVVICSEPYEFPKDHFVTCCAELNLQNPGSNSNGVSRLAVGVNVCDISGALVIFDPLRAQPIKLFSLPFPVTSLTVVSHVVGSGSNAHFFNEAMMTMVGIVAVGLKGGSVILVDLGLDQLPRSGVSHYVKDVFAKAPHSPVIVTPNETNIAFIRHQHSTERKVIALSVLNKSVDDNEIDPESFHYYDPNGTKIRTYPKKNIKVTSIEYISPIGLLLVGFDFGGFQLWRLDRLELVHSGSLPMRPNSIFGFSFSQPMDDPKNYAYLWVLYGKQGLEMHHSHAELYCMEFQDKPFIENVGYIYKDFQQCVQRLSFRLEDYFDGDGESGGQNGEAQSDSRYYVRPLKIWSPPSWSQNGSQAGNLTFFAWEAMRIGVYYVGIFDLNQWYSSRMLESLRFVETTGLCPYWVAIPVETTDTHRAIPICDVQLIPKTLERWKNPYCTLDVHLYPASLSFEAITLSRSATSTFQFFGVQEKLLRKLIDDGTKLMMAPTGIKKLLRTYGLRPILPQQYDESMPQDMADRFYIFSSLLDNRRPALIIKFAASWLDGAYSNAGCTVDLLLNWISAYTFSLRIMAKDHWEDLHRCHLEFLAPVTAHFIHYSNFVWESLLAVFSTITRPDEVFLAREAFINNLSTGLNKIVRYSAALRMMFKAEVLPERSDCDIISKIVADHDTRRKDVTAAIQRCHLLNSTFKSIRPMMIDYLLEAFDETELREQWHVDEGESLYPPKHIGYVLNLFLTDHDDPKDIARVAAYFLLDIRDVVTAEQKNKLRGDYLSVMQLSAEEEAEVYHLWLLDHGYVNEYLIFLKQPGRLGSYDLPWCAGVVACTALGMDDDVTQLLKRSCPAVLAPLFIKLMSRSGGLFSTIVETDSFKLLSKSTDFLSKFFQVSYEEGYMGEFIAASLRDIPSFVVFSLIEFLRSKSQANFACGDWLLSIYSNLGDTTNLRDQYDRMKQLYATNRKLTEDQQIRWNFREKLILTMLSSEEAKLHGVMDFIRKCDDNYSPYATARPKHSTVVIRPNQDPSISLRQHQLRHQTGGDNGLEGFLKNRKAQPQHQRLKLLREKQKPNVLSPLRRYAARLQSVLGTPHRGAIVKVDADDDMNTVSNIPSASTPVRRAMISILNYPAEEDVPGSGDEEEEACNLANSTSPGVGDDSSFFEKSMDARTNKSRNYPSPSPINLRSLLQPPEVDHREGRKSISFIGSPPSGSFAGSGNRSVYFTPGTSKNNSTLHSIMKKRDSTSRKNMEIRFLDASLNSELRPHEEEKEEESEEGTQELNKLFKDKETEELQEENEDANKGLKVTSINEKLDISTRNEPITTPLPVVTDQLATPARLRTPSPRNTKRRRAPSPSPPISPARRTSPRKTPSTPEVLDLDASQNLDLGPHEEEEEKEEEEGEEGTQELNKLFKDKETEVLHEENKDANKRLKVTPSNGGSISTGKVAKTGKSRKPRKGVKRKVEGEEGTQELNKLFKDKETEELQKENELGPHEEEKEEGEEELNKLFKDKETEELQEENEDANKGLKVTSINEKLDISTRNEPITTPLPVVTDQLATPARLRTPSPRNTKRRRAPSPSPSVSPARRTSPRKTPSTPEVLDLDASQNLDLGPHEEEEEKEEGEEGTQELNKLFKDKETEVLHEENEDTNKGLKVTPSNGGSISTGKVAKTDKSRKPRKGVKRKVGGFAPELSTVVEDSSASHDPSSTPDATQKQPSALIKPSGGKGRVTRKTTKPIESALLTSVVVEEVEQPKKRVTRSRTKSKEKETFADVSLVTSAADGGQDTSVLYTSSVVVEEVGKPKKRVTRSRTKSKEKETFADVSLVTSAADGGQDTSVLYTSSVVVEEVEQPRKRVTRSRTKSKEKETFADVSLVTSAADGGQDTSVLDTSIAQRTRRKTGNSATSQ